jgi:hypothetical protein
MITNSKIIVRLDARKFGFLSCYMSYLASNLIFGLKNYVKNVVLKKDFNLGVTSFFFHAFTPFTMQMGVLCRQG